MPDDTIDLYCERLTHGFWAEPANAVTNVAFLVAALAAFRLWRGRGGRDGPALALIAVTVCVGLGSFAFHTLATRPAMLADVLPIAVFIHGYFFMAMARFLGLRWWLALAATVGFAVAATVLSGALRPVFGGSAGYVPALLAIFGVAAAVAPRARRLAGALAAAGLVFTVSLAMRVLDAPVCDAFPLGTHFLWHLLNATVLYLLLRALIRSRPEARVSETPAAESGPR